MSEHLFDEIRKIDAEIKAEEAAKVGSNEEAKPEAEKAAEAERLVAEENAKAEAKAAEEAAANQGGGDKGEEGKGGDYSHEDDKKSWEDIVADEIKSQQEKVEQEKRNKLLEDPLIKAIAHARETGRDPKEIIKSLEAANPDGLDEKALFEMTLPEGMDEADRETAYERFSELPETTKQALVEQKRKELKSEYEKIQSSINSDPVKAYKENYSKSLDSVRESLNKIVGQEVNGVRISNKIAASIFQEAQSQLLANKDASGNFSAETALKKAVILSTASYIKEAAAKEAEQKAKAETFKEFHNPTGKGKVHGDTFGEKDKKKELEDKAVEDYARQFATFASKSS
jgi:hypothetical protein